MLPVSITHRDGVVEAVLEQFLVTSLLLAREAFLYLVIALCLATPDSTILPWWLPAADDVSVAFGREKRADEFVLGGAHELFCP